MRECVASVVVYEGVGLYIGEGCRREGEELWCAVVVLLLVLVLVLSLL